MLRLGYGIPHIAASSRSSECGKRGARHKRRIPANFSSYTRSNRQISHQIKRPPRPYPSGSDQVRYSGAKPGRGRDPGHSLLRFQSGYRLHRWTELKLG